MSKLTDEQKVLIVFNHTKLNPNQADDREFLQMVMGAVNAIEAAATEPLLQRIAELEKALKLVQQHHATAWNRGHIAGMAANRRVAQDALNAVKKDAWNNTQLTEALMAAEGRCEELEQRNRDLYEDVQRFKKHALNEKAARLELERHLEEARKLVLEEAAVECDKRAHAGDAGALMAARAIRAMQKGQPTVQRLPADDTEGGAV